MTPMIVLILIASLAGAGTAVADRPAPNTADSAGRRFFAAKVLPRLAENGCAMCHAVGYVQPNVLVYEELLPYLAMGDAPAKTPVIRKLANLRAIRPDLPTHPGGQRCETMASEPCRSIIEWWHVEFSGTTSATGVKP